MCDIKFMNIFRNLTWQLNHFNSVICAPSFGKILYFSNRKQKHVHIGNIAHLAIIISYKQLLALFNRVQLGSVGYISCFVPIPTTRGCYKKNIKNVSHILTLIAIATYMFFFCWRNTRCYQMMVHKWPN